METGKKLAQKNLPKKKELKKQLADTMEKALPELREMLGEKKFIHRLKKASKLLIEGLHKEEVPEKIKQLPKKVPAAKKTAVKTVKKAAAKTAKKAVTHK